MPPKDLTQAFNDTAPKSSLKDRPLPPKAPKPPKPPTARQKVTAFRGISNDVGSLSAPKFTSDTGAVVMLIVLNMMWSLFRSMADAPNADNTLGAASPLHPEFVQILTGTWVVGLGILIVHEVDPHVAMLLALLFVIGNVLTNNAGNKAAINVLSTVFSGKSIGANTKVAPLGGVGPKAVSQTAINVIEGK